MHQKVQSVQKGGNLARRDKRHARSETLHIALVGPLSIPCCVNRVDQPSHGSLFSHQNLLCSNRDAHVGILAILVRNHCMSNGDIVGVTTPLVCNERNASASNNLCPDLCQGLGATHKCWRLTKSIESGWFWLRYQCEHVRGLCDSVNVVQDCASWNWIAQNNAILDNAILADIAARRCVQDVGKVRRSVQGAVSDDVDQTRMDA